MCSAALGNKSEIKNLHRGEFYSPLPDLDHLLQQAFLIGSIAHVL